jgi:predicted CXXCH cytochrome family protein
MRRGTIFMAALVLTAPTLALAGTIANTKHDLSSTSSAAIKSTTQSDTCVFCHIAHNSTPGVSRPLWSHTMTTATLTWNPVKTVRGTSLPTDITSAQLAGSRACMSCHDGTVALGDLIKGIDATVTGPNAPAGKLNLGVNYFNPAAMESNHPLGVSKPLAVPGFTGFKTVSSTSAVNYDASGYVQCDSCHNPHDNTYAPFLKINNAGGAICLTCHDV